MSKIRRNPRSSSSVLAGNRIVWLATQDPNPQIGLTEERLGPSFMPEVANVHGSGGVLCSVLLIGGVFTLKDIKV